MVGGVGNRDHHRRHRRISPCSEALERQTCDPTASTPESTDYLAALIVTDVPSGFALQPDCVGDTGPVDLAKAARDHDDPNTEERLRSEGFVHGYQRLWVDPSDAEIIVFLDQFATDAGARQNWTRITSQAAPGAAPFTVDGLPCDSTWAIQYATADFAVAVVDFTTGVYSVEIVCNATTLEGLQERMSALARNQFSRLDQLSRQ